MPLATQRQTREKPSSQEHIKVGEGTGPENIRQRKESRERGVTKCAQVAERFPRAGEVWPELWKMDSAHRLRFEWSREGTWRGAGESACQQQSQSRQRAEHRLDTTVPNLAGTRWDEGVVQEAKTLQSMNSILSITGLYWRTAPLSDLYLTQSPRKRYVG